MSFPSTIPPPTAGSKVTFTIEGHVFEWEYGTGAMAHNGRPMTACSMNIDRWRDEHGCHEQALVEGQYSDGERFRFASDVVDAPSELSEPRWITQVDGD